VGHGLGNGLLERASNSAATRCWGQAKSRPPPAAITREQARAISGLDGIHKAMDSVAERTTDRGITAAQNYTAVMARPGDEVAAGDGLVAFGAAFILSVQMHLWADGSTVPQWPWRKQSHARADLKADKQGRQIQH
jgi:hypothetical protein